MGQNVKLAGKIRAFKTPVDPSILNLGFAAVFDIKLHHPFVPSKPLRFTYFYNGHHAVMRGDSAQDLCIFILESLASKGVCVIIKDAAPHTTRCDAIGTGCSGSWARCSSVVHSDCHIVSGMIMATDGSL